MNASPVIISGLREIAGDYDALVCDVWGVVHDGLKAFAPAVAALRRFQAQRGRVVLLSNAPRPTAEIEIQLAGYGVPRDCYDAVVTSGSAAREDLARRAARGGLPILHIGPERDRPLYAGLDIVLAGAETAEVVLCSGLYDDEIETPEHYRGLLTRLAERGLPMICANPDLIVPRGGKLVHCAGALAKSYEELGGKVAYYGKPHAPIYAVALQAAGHPARPLVVGDSLETDILGANAMGLDALFIADGVHARELGGLMPGNLAGFFGRKGLRARAACRTLVW